MSRDDARLTSYVRSHVHGRTRPEPGVERDEGRREAPVRLRTSSSRFRLERVSLLPFIPAPLLDSIARAHARRRRRLLFLALASSTLFGGLLAWALGAWG